MTKTNKDNNIYPIVVKKYTPVRIFRQEDAATYCGVSSSYFSSLVSQRIAPAPISIGSGVKGWDIHALDQWIDSLSEIKAELPNTAWTKRA
jgi:predicted DNA-binding transcriptional regulator AlpA